MTELTYGPPTLPATPGRVVAGRILTVLMSVIGPPAAAFTAILGAITYSGCFIDCGSDDHPNHLQGSLLVAVAVALLLAAPVLAAALVRRWTWVAGALAVPVVEVALIFGHSR